MLLVMQRDPPLLPFREEDPKGEATGALVVWEADITVGYTAEVAAC